MVQKELPYITNSFLLGERIVIYRNSHSIYGCLNFLDINYVFVGVGGGE